MLWVGNRRNRLPTCKLNWFIIYCCNSRRIHVHFSKIIGEFENNSLILLLIKQTWKIQVARYACKCVAPFLVFVHPVHVTSRLCVFECIFTTVTSRYLLWYFDNVIISTLWYLVQIPDPNWDWDFRLCMGPAVLWIGNRRNRLPTCKHNWSILFVTRSRNSFPTFPKSSGVWKYWLFCDGQKLTLRRARDSRS